MRYQAIESKHDNVSIRSPFRDEEADPGASPDPSAILTNTLAERFTTLQRIFSFSNRIPHPRKLVNLSALTPRSVPRNTHAPAARH